MYLVLGKEETYFIQHLDIYIILRRVVDARADNAPLVRCGGSVRGARSECGGATFQLARYLSRPSTITDTRGREQVEHALLQTQHLSFGLDSYELLIFVASEQLINRRQASFRCLC